MSAGSAGPRPGSLCVLRTPLLPFEVLEAWGDGLTAAAALAAGGDLEAAVARDRAALRAGLARALDQPAIAEALFVASPDLASGLAAWHADPDSKKGRRLEQGLTRYLLRMVTRPTPFGLFSGCTAGGFGQATRLSLVERARYRRASRLDMDYLFALCENLGRSPALRSHLRFQPSSSLSRLGERLHYAEARLAGKRRTYHLVAVDRFPELEQVLARARSGATLDELASDLVASDPSAELGRDEAREFVETLADQQLLLPTLSPQVTGGDALTELLAQLAELASCAREAAQTHTLLAAAQRHLAALDEEGLGQPSRRYEELAANLEPLGTPVELARLVQVDLIKPAAEITLGESVVAELVRGIELLHRLARPPVDHPLDLFCLAFQERYGTGREVPLCEALDEELGLGFERSGAAAADGSPLLAELALQPRTGVYSVPRSERDRHLLQLLTRALAAGQDEIELTAADLEPLASDAPPPLPSAFSVMAALAAPSAEAVERGDFEVVFQGCFGPSGARMLGRFCPADAAIRAGVAEHLAQEEALDPEAIYAELAHLPAGRVGNVLARPVLRGWEIPFLGRSGAPVERQIELDDLWVSVAAGRVQLRSRRLGRPVVPRLSTAHNTSRESLGVYRFLAALQDHRVAPVLGWTWGTLEESWFLPRVRCGRLVLSRARWRVGAAELAPLVAATGAERFRRVQAWRAGRRLPRHVSLLDGDNALFVDLENVLGLDAWLELVKGREQLMLAEVYPGPQGLCVTGPEGRFVHELIVPFVQPAEAPAAARPPACAPAVRPVPRSFPPGSGWLYARLYTGTATADRLLRDVVQPLVADASARGAVERWFFLRYGDPSWHLRLRLAGPAAALRSEVLPALLELAAPYRETGAIWKIQLDTYERELERYGGAAAVETVEEIFQHDSEAVLGLLATLTGDDSAERRWQLCLLGMDRLLADFGLDLEARCAFAAEQRQLQGKRYRAEPLQASLAGKLRQERRSLEALLREPAEAPGLAALARRSRALAGPLALLHTLDRADELTPPLRDFLPSLVHMHVNRLCRSAGPEHELVLYDFLHELYRSQLARLRPRVGRDTLTVRV